MIDINPIFTYIYIYIHYIYTQLYISISPFRHLYSELSRFIAAGRLNCVIDKVNGVVLTNKIDQRSEQYQAVLKHGDQIINKMQKLGRIISY